MRVRARLEAFGLTALPLTPETGFSVRSVDKGDAETREVVSYATDADGTIDTTNHIGARNITMAVTITATPGETREEKRRRLRAFTAPALRPYLFLSEDGLPEVRIQMRRGSPSFGNVLEVPGRADCLLQWVAPMGVFESAEEHLQDVYASSLTVTALGRNYPLTFPRSYPFAAPTGAASLVNVGNIDTYPLLRLYGPFTDPILDNVTQSKSLALTGITLGPGEFLEIDTRARTIFLNGDPDVNRYDKLAFPGSKWWSLGPGITEVRFHPATYTVGVTRTQFAWRDNYL